MYQEKASVIIPAYNREGLVEQQLENAVSHALERTDTPVSHIDDIMIDYEHKPITYDFFKKYCQGTLLTVTTLQQCMKELKKEHYHAVVAKVTQNLLSEQCKFWFNNLYEEDKLKGFQLMCKVWDKGISYVLSHLINQFYNKQREITAYVKDDSAFRYQPKKIKTIALYYRSIFNGGAQRIVAQLCNLFAEYQVSGVNQYTVVLITDELPQEGEYSLSQKVKREYIPHYTLFPKEDYYERAQAWYDIIHKHKVDIVLNSAWMYPSKIWDALIIKSHPRHPAYVNHIHHFWGIAYQSHIIDQFQTLHGFIDGLVVLSQLDKKFWLHSNPSTYYIPNPCYLKALKQHRSVYDNKAVVWVARLHAQKQPFEIVRIMKYVVKEIPTTVCYVVGDGDNEIKNKLLQLIELENLKDNIILTGFQQKVSEYYQKSSVFLSTSLYEGWNLTLFEAASYGLPAVTYDLPGLEYYNIMEGWSTVPQKNARDAAKEIIHLLQDKSYWQQQSDKAFSSCQNFLETDFLQPWLDVFEDIKSSTQPCEIIDKEEGVILRQISHFFCQKQQTAQNEKAELSKKIQTAQNEKAELNQKLNKAYRNRWYRFGTYSRKRKIWVMGKVISKKLYIYWLLRPFAKLVKKVFLRKKTILVKHKPNNIVPERKSVQSSSTFQGNPATILNYYKEPFVQQVIEDQSQRYKKHINPYLDKIQLSNGTRYYHAYDVSVGIICDEFLYNLYKDVTNIIYITPENYENHINTIDFFMVVSTWRGLHGEWYGKSKQNIIPKIIDFYKRQDKPIVFYSKEDPVHYNNFLHIAQKADVIFTTAEEKVADYRRDCGHGKVFLLPFACNPLEHNPISSQLGNYVDEVIFAGTYYHKYPSRTHDMNYIFDGLLTNGYRLHIFDRCWELSQEKYSYPSRYLSCIKKPLDNVTIQKISKLYPIAININTVKNSANMLANRVYELQAAGLFVLSNYAMSVNDIFPNIYIALNQDLHSFDVLKDKEYLYKTGMYNVRQIYRKDTVYNRFSYILEKVGIDHKSVSEHKIVVVVDKVTEHLQECFNQQSYEWKILVTQDNLSSLAEDAYSMVAFFSDMYDYEEYYLEDLVNGFKYTDSDYIVKDSYYAQEKKVEGEEHSYISYLKDKYRAIFWRESYTIDELLNINDSTDLPNGYAVDCFEIEEYVVNKGFIEKDKTYKLSVIVPCYNNGDHLLYKCIQSLKQSSMFEDMEILLIDDGSSDLKTLRIIKRLTRQYANIKSYFFPAGGSGSASRPRNKGIDIATSDYVTFLDPDNMAINDGYTKLYNTLIETGNDFIISDYIIVRDGKENYHATQYKKCLSRPDTLVQSNFKHYNPQSAIYRRGFLQEHSIYNVEGAIGEDTVFGYETLLNSRDFSHIHEATTVYFAENSESTVNTINANFFKRYFPVEQYKIDLFKKHDILLTYYKLKYEQYFKEWYLKKYKNLRVEEIPKATEVLLKIYNMHYEQGFRFFDSYCKKFIELAKNKDYESLQAVYVKGREE